MPGAYAHLTLAKVASEAKALRSIQDFPEQAVKDVNRYPQFRELGAVSPDYPYLALGDAAAGEWADLMHKERTGTGEMIREGVRRVRGLDGERRSKCLAWLFGYSSHVVGDVTVHPVVSRKVGPYEENKSAHRICEMHQDAYIFKSRLNVGGIETSDYLQSGIIRAGNGDGVDPEVGNLWNSLLAAVYPAAHSDNRPDIDKWHRRFVNVCDTIDDWSRLPAWARHVSGDCGLTYPTYEEVKRTYTTQLKVPSGGRPMSYDEIFDKAVENVRAVWKSIASAVYGGDETYAFLVMDWDLDSGTDPGGQTTYWV